MKIFIHKILPFVDILILPFVYPSAWLLKFVRKTGVNRLPNCRNALIRIGIFPIRDHYFEPQFDYRKTNQPLSQDRTLSGIELNVDEQLSLLSKFSFSQEITDIPKEKTHSLEFYLNNGSFYSGDAEFWYQLIRLIKPRRIFEIGSGYSTLMAIQAVRKNNEQCPGHKCEHVCIEPYEAPWLAKTGVIVKKQKVEDLDIEFFATLQENDILFIDSSHIIRPQGDVLYEYLKLLPTLKKGVIVHIHDIFSPKNYPRQWLAEKVLFWNEQYLLEAFLTHNKSWKIIGGLNYLHHNHYDALKSVAPSLSPCHEPGSFYIQKIA